MLRGAVILAVFQGLYSEVRLGRVFLGVFYSNAEVFRGSILSILGVLPSIYMFVRQVLRVLEDKYLLLILPVLAVFRPSVLLILPVLAVFI